MDARCPGVRRNDAGIDSRNRGRHGEASLTVQADQEIGAPVLGETSRLGREPWPGAGSADFQPAGSRISNPHSLDWARSADWKSAIQQVGNLRYDPSVPAARSPNPYLSQTS